MPAPFADHDAIVDWLTGGDYESSIPTEASPGETRVLARAWEVIDDHTLGMVEYDEDGEPVDDEGAPDAAAAAVLADAVCAQIEQWLEVGEENDIAGFDRVTFMSTGISVNRLPSILAPRAARILRRAGMLGANPDQGAPITVVLV